MDSGANLRDTRTLMAAKATLTKAGRSFATAIEEAQSDADRFGMWLNGEGPAHWTRQRRILTEKLNADRAALFRKQIQPTADGRPPSTVDERKAVLRSERAVQHADDCLRNLRRWAIEYQRVVALFRAGLGPLTTYVDQIVPEAVASLNRMAQSIDGYLSTSPGKVDPGLEIGERRPDGSLGTDSGDSMRRAGTDPVPEERPNE